MTRVGGWFFGVSLGEVSTLTLRPGETPRTLPGALPNNAAAFARQPNRAYSACDDSRLSRAAGCRCDRPVSPIPLGEDRVTVILRWLHTANWTTVSGGMSG